MLRSVVLGVVVAVVLAADPRSWPPKFVGNISCDHPEDYLFRAVALAKLGLIGFNALLYSSVSLKASPETGNVTGTFGSFYTITTVVNNVPPTQYLASYDAAAGWGGALNPITANVSAASSFAAIEFQTLTGRYLDGTLGTINLANFVWIMGDVKKEGGLSYVLFSGLGGQVSVRIDVCISDVLGKLAWGAEMIPTAMKTRITVSGEFPNGPIKDLNLTMVVASATLDVAASTIVSAEALLA